MVSFSRRVEAEVWEPEAHEPGCSRQGWQHEAASRVEEEFREALFPDLSPSRQALLRSQSGPRSRCSFLCDPFVDAHVDRTSLVPGAAPTAPSFLCLCQIASADVAVHSAHVATIAQLAVGLARWVGGGSHSSAAARICREGGARVVPNMLVRNMDLDVLVADVRRLEVVADGLPMWGGVQLAIDTTLVSALRGDGNPRRGASCEMVWP